MRLLFILYSATTLALAATSQPSDQPSAEFVEMKVRPVLAGKCYGCHTDAKSGGLQLDSREHILKGGNSGPAIIPGDPDHSLLIQALRQTHPRIKMPPGGKLPDDDINNIAAWIKAGAAWPAGPAKPVSYVITDAQRNFWSFKPVVEPKPPVVHDAKWPHNDIDRFVLSKLESKGI